MVVDLARIERREPAAVEPRAHEAGLRIQHVLPVLRGGHKLLIFSEMPKPERHLCHAPVVEGILKRFRHAFVFIVGQHETVSAETVHAECRVVRGRDQRLERVLIVKALKPARDCVRDYGGAVVAYHAVGLPAGELPDGELARFIIDREHGPDEVHGPLGLDFGQQRMQAAEGVPKGEDGITVPAVRPMHLAVHAAVFAAKVAVEARVNRRVI